VFKTRSVQAMGTTSCRVKYHTRILFRIHQNNSCPRRNNLYKKVSAYWLWIHTLTP